MQWDRDPQLWTWNWGPTPTKIQTIRTGQGGLLAQTPASSPFVQGRGGSTVYGLGVGAGEQNLVQGEGEQFLVRGEGESSWSGESTVFSLGVEEAGQ